MRADKRNNKLNPITRLQTINLEQHLINRQNVNPKIKAIAKLTNIIGQVTPKSLVDDNLSPILTPFNTNYSIFLLFGKHMIPNVSVVGYITVVLL